MDRFEKHAEYIMKRGDKILAEKATKVKMARRIAFSLSGVIITIISSYFIWKSVPPFYEKPFSISETESTSVSSASNIQVTAETTKPAITTIKDNSEISVQSTVTTTVEKKALNTTAVATDKKTENIHQQATDISETVSAKVTTAKVTTAKFTTAQALELTVTNTEPINEYVTEVIWERFYGNDISNPVQNQFPNPNLVMKCKSFCAVGEKLTVDVAMADASLGTSEYDASGDYKYEVYVCDLKDYKNIEDNNFIVNGKHRRYRKEYSNEDAELFDTNGRIDDYNSYHHETTEIDFSGYGVGNCGCIKFSFTRECTDNPHHTSCIGANQYMYFYVGEDGTFINNKEFSDNRNDLFSDSNNKNGFCRRQHDHRSVCN